MNLAEQILALLRAQFPGVREDGLQQLAAAIGLQVETVEEATDIVGKLTADKVGQFVKDWRSKADAEIGKANQTYENRLKEKYDFVEKGKQTDPKPTEPPTDPKGGVTLEQVKQLLSEQLGGLQKSITDISNNRVAETRRGAFVAALDKAKVEGAKREMLLGNYERMTFKDDADFAAFMTSQETQFAALAQEEADKGLLDGGKPIFGAVNKDGISTGVADYIASKQAGGNNALTGKEV